MGQEYVRETRGKGLAEGSASGRVWKVIGISLSCLSLLIAAVIVTVTICFFLSPVDGGSMTTTLNAGYFPGHTNTDTVFASKFSNPKRGDIIICKWYLTNPEKAPQSLQQSLLKDDEGWFIYVIKRLIAIEGDTLSVTKNGDSYTIYLNGEVLNEPYLDPQYGRYTAANYARLYNSLGGNFSGASVYCKWTQKDIINRDTHSMVIPSGYWFYMGDNRTGSEDGSYYGPQLKSHFVGKAEDVMENGKNIPSYLLGKLFGG